MKAFSVVSTGVLQLLLLCLVIPSFSTAATTSIVSELQARARQQSLWLDQEWLNLVHYEKDGGDSYLSQVDDRRFFTASEGKTDPEAELMATIAAFYIDEKSGDNSGDEHAQCRFIARLEWMKQKLSIDPDSLPQMSCPLYRDWRARVPDHRVTMVFPAYHLNSPSSMYGHTLLRLDPKPEDMGSDWLSVAVNFGADVRAEDNSMFFAIKGLTGGYPGFFIVTPYFEKIKEYNRNEKRDIWEYPLNLSPEETRRLISHLWELKTIAFDYYFFDENCSYRLLELLEVARPGVELTDEFVLTAIPVDTVRAIERENMIQSVDYRPSNITVLEQLLEGIPAEQQELILRLSTDASLTESPQFSRLSAAEQKRAVEIAYKYIRSQQAEAERKPEVARQSFALLKALNSYPASASMAIRQTGTQPEAGHLSKRLATMIGRDDNKDYVEVAVRMSFHSLEDNETGFLRGAQINTGSLQVRATEDEDIQLQQLDLVDIFSLTPRSRFFKPLSWRIYSGLERQVTFGQDRLVTHISGGMGVTYQPFADNFSYALLTLRVERNRGFDDRLAPAAGLILGSLHHFGGSTAKLEFSGEQFDNDEYRVRGRYVQNVVLARNHSILLQARREHQRDLEFSEFGLAYQFYF